MRPALLSLSDDPPGPSPEDVLALAGFGRLPVEPLGPDALPPAVRRLLDHDRGMTAVLEDGFGEPMALAVLDTSEQAGRLRRTVRLSGQKTGRPAELGLITINLDNLPATVREAVRSAQLPFGTVLRQNAIAFVSRPYAFFRTAADPRLSELLGLRPGAATFGRATRLTDGAGRTLAEAVEIIAAAP